MYFFKTAIWLFILISTLCGVYVLANDFIKVRSDHRLLKYLFWGLILLIILVLSIGKAVIDIYSAIRSVNISIKVSATITTAIITIISIITTAFGLLFKNKQDKIQKLHSESNWRSRLLDLEKKPYYTINDLLELNTFINPYHKKADNLDYFINLAIRTILNSKALDIKPEHEFDYFYKKVNETLNDKKLSINKKVLMILKKEEFYNNLYGCEQDLELKKNKFEADDVTDTTVKVNSEKKYQIFKCETFSDYKIKYINKNNKQIDFFNPYETVVIRKCIHALLKDDWVRVND